MTFTAVFRPSRRRCWLDSIGCYPSEVGHPLRVYVPFGTQWYPYFMRRLAERPALIDRFVAALGVAYVEPVERLLRRPVAVCHDRDGIAEIDDLEDSGYRTGRRVVGVRAQKAERLVESEDLPGRGHSVPLHGAKEIHLAASGVSAEIAGASKELSEGS